MEWNAPKHALNGLNRWVNGHDSLPCSIYMACKRAKQPCRRAVPIPDDMGLGFGRQVGYFGTRDKQTCPHDGGTDIIRFIFLLTFPVQIPLRYMRSAQLQSHKLTAHLHVYLYQTKPNKQNNSPKQYPNKPTKSVYLKLTPSCTYIISPQMCLQQNESNWAKCIVHITTVYLCTEFSIH